MDYRARREEGRLALGRGQANGGGVGHWGGRYIQEIGMRKGASKGFWRGKPWIWRSRSPFLGRWTHYIHGFGIVVIQQRTIIAMIWIIQNQSSLGHDDRHELLFVRPGALVSK
jgi:hypothetical protein